MNTPLIQTSATSHLLGAWYSPLDNWRVIRFSGADAIEFLHGQISNDVKGLPEGVHRIAGYCSPKGRLLGVLRYWRAAQDASAIEALLPLERVEPLSKRLRMFVMRAKCVIEATPLKVWAFGGPTAQALASGVVLHQNEATLLGLSQGSAGSKIESAYAIALTPGDFPPALQKDAAALPDSGLFDTLTLHTGLPVIEGPNVEQYVPQMVNLDLVGGVVYDKGCYPGQEIVARSHYLGKLKRRMYLGDVEGATDAPRPSTDVWWSEEASQPAGTVVNAAKSPSGGVSVLIEIPTAASEAGSLHIKDPERGYAITLKPLPYTVPAGK